MNLSSSYIELNDLRFHAFHGDSELEQKVGNNFSVNLRLQVSISVEAWKGDELSGTIDYAEVFEVLRAEFLKPSRLIENVAWRCAQTLFKHFERVSTIEIKVEKLNPPMGADGRSAAVMFKAERN